MDTVKCPKCGEPDLIWQKNTNGKNWLKKSLGEGQLSKGWHNCDKYKPDLNQGTQTPVQKGFKKIPCKKCGNVVYHNPKHESYDPSEPCTVCNERDGKV